MAEADRYGQRRPEPTRVMAAIMVAVQRGARADERQRVRRTSAAEFNRRVCAMPLPGLREPERLHPKARRLDCPGVGRL